MYAVIRTGGKQYYVTAGDILEVEKLVGNVGDTIALDEVLLVAGAGDVTVGQPVVTGASVMAKITGQHRGQKIRVFRYRPKKRIRVRRGHRQYLTRIQVQSIRLADGTEFQISEPVAAEEVEPVSTMPVAEETAVDQDTMADTTGGADAELADNDSAVTAESENAAALENKE